MYSLLKAQKWWQTNECLADTQVCNLWPTEHSHLYLITGCNGRILSFISVWLAGPGMLVPVLLKLNVKPWIKDKGTIFLLIHSFYSYYCCHWLVMICGKWRKDWDRFFPCNVINWNSKRTRLSNSANWFLVLSPKPEALDWTSFLFGFVGCCFVLSILHLDTWFKTMLFTSKKGKI